MKKIITLILSLSLSILLMGCSNITHGKEAYRYNDDEDIKITHTKESTVAKIEIQDSYTKGGQKYFEITTSATGNEIFTYSESEYDKVFGLENDAVDCEIYTLQMESTIAEYKKNYFSEYTALSYFDANELTQFNPEELEFPSYASSSNISSLLNEWSVKCSTYEKERKKVVVHNDYESKSTAESHYLSSKIEETRYSFFGESDFTEEEIENYKEEMNTLNLFVLEAFDAQK